MIKKQVMSFDNSSESNFIFTGKCIDNICIIKIPENKKYFYNIHIKNIEIIKKITGTFLYYCGEEIIAKDFSIDEKGLIDLYVYKTNPFCFNDMYLNTGIVNGNAKLECKFVFEGKFDTDDEVVLQVTFLEPSDPPTCFNYKNLSIILLKNEGKTIIRYHKNTGKINQYLNIY